jgi:hypothetical protein
VLVYLQVEAASCRSAAGKAARVGLLQAEQRRSNGGQLQAEQPKVNVVLQVEAAKVCLGGSTVPAAVVIVVKYRAYLSVGRLIIGV